jgi:hypothetical protein
VLVSADTDFATLLALRRDPQAVGYPLPPTGQRRPRVRRGRRVVAFARARLATPGELPEDLTEISQFIGIL